MNEGILQIYTANNHSQGRWLGSKAQGRMRKESICYFRQLEQCMKHFGTKTVPLVAETVTNTTATSIIRHLHKDT